MIEDLNWGIERYPDNATNYVLRGEWFLGQKQYLLAQADFERALELVEVQVQTDEWGIISQAMRDRAMSGLRRVAYGE